MWYFWFIINVHPSRCNPVGLETQALMAPGGAGKAGFGLRRAGGGQGGVEEAQNREGDKALLPK